MIRLNVFLSSAIAVAFPTVFDYILIMLLLFFHLLLLLISLGVCQSGGVIATLVGGIFLLGALPALIIDLASLFVSSGDQ